MGRLTRSRRVCLHLWRRRLRVWSRTRMGVVSACSSCRREWARDRDPVHW